ncbi:epidermal growth factor receptor kinase substrate 8-like protein 3b isoform X2 [Heptranchias perlo]|uniref:epidermal growth factor receptor kinase substrate 8-like protein 3b isoform X2 n=1 Tax=Heptranchias perlo TaxID=212740 RepID=UPI003559C04B
MYGDYGNRRIPDDEENHSQANGFTPEKSPFQRSQSISNRPTAKMIYQQRKAYAQMVGSTDDLIQYRVEHLITCDLDSNEMTTVDHSIKKLQLLDATGKVWGQDMILQLNGTAFKLADVETKDDLELFPIDAIQDCQAVLDSCVYNSVLAVTIRDRNKRKSSIYLFQCEEVAAELIQNDIEKMIRGKKEQRGNQEMLRNNLESTLSRHLQPPHAKSAAPPPLERWMPPDYLHPAMSEHGSWAEQRSRTPSEHGSRYTDDDTEKTYMSISLAQRNMDIFNHILDDVELFNDKIIQAIYSNPQKKKKKKSKKSKEVLPPEEEYVSCLQKIKYGINLLSKVESYLQVPSAVDLVHALFQTLEFILRHIPKPDLAQNVISPLLVTDAIQLLRSSTTTEELHIWKSLGDAWAISRLDWPNAESIPGYSPTFSSGWEPPLLQSQRSPTPNQYMSNGREQLKEQISDPPGAPFKRSQKGPQFAKAMYDFMKRNNRELTVMKGDVLEVLEAAKQWWKVRNLNGNVGYVPSNIMQPVNQEESPSSPVENRRSFRSPSHADSPGLTIHFTPTEVTAWLQMKGFSRVTVKSLGVLTGSQLLSLTKEEMKMISVNEGGIVYNEIHSGH